MTVPRTLFLTHSGVLGGAERSLLDLAGAWPAERRLMVLAEGPMVHAARGRGIPVDVEPLGALAAMKRESGAPGPVSYTHLTLPTSDLV